MTKNQITLSDYDFLNAQGVYYNMALSRTGLLTNYLREFLDMSFTRESFSVSGSGLFDYMECLSHEKYTLSPLAILTLAFFSSSSNTAVNCEPINTEIIAGGASLAPNR